MDTFDDRQAYSQSAALFAAMSHDLRTPLNGVLGMAELLLTADDLNDRHRRRVEIIKRSGQNLLTMLEQLFEFSRIEAQESTLEIAPFDLREVMRDVQSALQSTVPGVVLVDGLGDHHRVVGDAPRVKKLLTNFVNSALKFAAAEPVSIAAKARLATTESLLVRFEAQDAKIDIGAIARVLELLEQGERLPSEGMNEAGLGLLICHKLAIMLGGHIGVDHPSGESPVFWLEIELEASARHAAAHDLAPAPATAEDCDPGTVARDVLVAEDNPDMALLIEDFLEEAGYQATVVPDGASVLKILGEQHFDVVLMDGRMPDMTGFETTDRIRALPDERANVPIIALTADALAGDREKYLSAGMDDYVAKPVDYEELLAAIERCCREKRREMDAAIAS